MSEISRQPSDQYVFEKTHSTEEFRRLIESGEFNSEQQVGLAGRLLSIRNQGKIVFADLYDQDGGVQIVAQDSSTTEFEKFTDHNVGDWVGAIGSPGKSRRGEPSLFVSDWRTLARTEIPFPDVNQGGLKDPEVISRQRYLDLATSPESMKVFKNRSRIVSLVRRSFEDQGFIEVETPILQTLQGGAAAKPFETHHNALDIELFMRIAPELFLKRLVVGGMERVFEIGKVFRNEGISIRHNPEFTMVEAYAAYWDGERQMQLTENLVSSIAQEITGSTIIESNGRSVDLTPPWPRVTMDKLIGEQLSREVSLSTPMDELIELCKAENINVESSYGPGKLLLELYEKLVESKLWGPIFVTDYPAEVSPLARGHRDKPGYTERFEGIVAGSELCNGFSELNDPREQYLRFKDQERASEHDDETMPMDYDYIRALKYGLPCTAGLGIGIDRLVMLITDSRSIRDVVLFPTLRPDGYKTEY